MRIWLTVLSIALAARTLIAQDSQELVLDHCSRNAVIISA
jgi:hypothetical protein